MKRFLATAVCTWASCASLQSPAGPAPERSTTDAATTSLVAVEGRPAGVVLRLKTERTDAASVELYRVVDNGDPELLQNLTVTEELAATLAAGLEIVDSTVSPARTFTYQMFTIAPNDAVLERSNVVELGWNPPPPRPAEVAALAPFTDVVELSWVGAPSYGAIVFRRDVLANGRFERVATIAAPATTWVDRDVSAGGVWSYRVALAFEHDSGFVQFGTPSEEVYASAPELR